MAYAAALLGVATTLYSSQQQAQAEQQQGQAARAQGAYATRTNNLNAEYADQSARDAIARGDLEAERLQTQTRGTVGSQRASFGAQGVDVNYGSSMDVQGDTLKMSGVDADTIRMNAYKDSLGLKTQAEGYRSAGDMAKRQAEGEFGAANAAANTTLITGGLRATSQYLGYYSQAQDTRRPSALRS